MARKRAGERHVKKTYVYIYIYIYMYVRMYVCIYVCMYVCTYACMYACMYVYMYVCKYLFKFQTFLFFLFSLQGLGQVTNHRCLQRLLDRPLSLFPLGLYLILSLGILLFLTTVANVLSIVIYVPLLYLLLIRFLIIS